MFVCLFGFLTSSSTTRLYRGRAPRQERLTILRAATHETELGDHDFCLSRSHYTDTDPTCRERAATAGIKPGTSSPGVARSTAELPRPHLKSQIDTPLIVERSLVLQESKEIGISVLHRGKPLYCTSLRINFLLQYALVDQENCKPTFSLDWPPISVAVPQWFPSLVYNFQLTFQPNL